MMMVTYLLRSVVTSLRLWLALGAGWHKTGSRCCLSS